MRNPKVLMLACALTLGQAGAAYGAETRDPADPAASVPGSRYEPVLRGYEGDASVDRPGDWRAFNDLMEQIGGPAGQLREQDEAQRDE